MSGIVRLDVIVLAIMLAGVVVVIIRFSFRFYWARRRKEIATTSRRKLAAALSIELASLRAIGSGAPYVGLAGTCVGIMCGLGFGGIGMAKSAALALIAARIALALVTTTAGILVAIPVTCTYNYICTRKDLLESEAPDVPPAQISRDRLSTRRFGLTKRLSQLPAFALMAARVLAALVAVDTPYFAPREPIGLELKLAPSCPENYANDQVTVLQITVAGKLIFNAEQEDWNGLAGRVSEIYRVRTQRTLDLVADDGVPFQTVVDALDIVENVPVTVGSHVAGTEMEKLDITVRLLTPRVFDARCPESVVGGSSKRALR
jgi:biopolymer transport protein ExbD